MNTLIRLAESGWLPDSFIRYGIRSLLASRLQGVTRQSPDGASATRAFAERMKSSPLVLAADEANLQHYEVPSEFFERTLGSRLKYSCALWVDEPSTLDQAEEAMLALTCERAEIEDGMEILELGCGWGSLSLWMAEKYPQSRILAVSNSSTQRKFIESRCKELGYDNLEVVTANVADFDTERRFDRVVSVEMFEHVRNHAELFRRIADWLAPEGKLFVHIFCHRNAPYTFEVDGPQDWMARHFFTGGMMPSAELFNEYHEDLRVISQWQVNGSHYSRTCEAWLLLLDNHRAELQTLFEQDADSRTANVRLRRWRMFYLACSELFNYRDGEEWFVCHYLFEHQTQQAGTRDRLQLNTSA